LDEEVFGFSVAGQIDFLDYGLFLLFLVGEAVQVGEDYVLIGV
jgi:hypothetical protein